MGDEDKDMADHPPKKVSPVWHSDVPGMLGCALALPIICILTGVLLPVLGAIRQAEAWNLFVTGLALATAGVLLLGYARWPLYRQKRFFCFGSRLLDTPHRRCYRAAYVLIIAAILLLLMIVLAKLRREGPDEATTRRSFRTIAPALAPAR